MSEFLWHEIGEAEKEKILAKSKEILDSFSKSLESANLEGKESFITREIFERVEGIEEKCSSDEFRKIMFENSDSKNSDFLIAEKKSW